MKKILTTFGIILLINSQLSAQTVTGTVSDASSGETLPGVNITVKGTTTGTSTDENGNYQLQVTSLQDTLVFSFVGFQKREVPLNSRTTVDILLSSQVLEGEEMVVVGYGTMERGDITGSVSSVKVDELSQGVTSSVDQMLVGKSSGVNVVQNSGEPGGGFSINIRGSSSINANNGPLYVIDGVPVDKGGRIAQNGLNLGNSRSPRNALSFLNPGDIENIEILKDASATAIYGSRGANGVIMITTKGGHSDQMQIDYYGSIGVQNWTNKLDLLTAEDYKRVLNNIIDVGGEDPSFRVPDDISSTDWQNEIAHENAIVQNQQLSFSGGSENTSYYISFNHMAQEGIIKSSSYARYGGKVNIESQLSNKFTLGANVTGSYSSDDYIPNGGAAIENSGALQAAYTFDPTMPVKNSDGSFVLNELISVDNPVALIEGVDSQSNTNRTLASTFAEYDIIPNLLAKMTIAGDFSNDSRKTFVNDKTRLGRQNNGIGTNQNRERSHVLFEGTLNYNKSADNHHINALGGITYERYVQENIYIQSSDFPSQTIGGDNLGLGREDNFELSNGKTAHRLASYIGRLNYTFMDKYMLTLTSRLDGSSRFGENNKFAFFPSGAIGWNLTEEKFMDELEIFSNLKLRASWGQSGNQEIGNYPSRSTYSEGQSAVFNDNAITTTSPSRIPNPDLKWENTEQINLGVDFGLWQNRLEGNFDWFRKTTKDLLLNLPIPTSTGFNTKLSNVGEVRNTGFEVSLSSQNITRQNIQWSSDISISMVDNKVMDLGPISEIITGGAPTWGGGIGLIRPGNALRSFFGWEVEGIWQEGDDFSVTTDNVQPGSIKFVDRNSDGTVNDEDRVILGDSFPDLQWSLGNTISYMSFELFAFVEAVQGVEMLNTKKIETFYPINFRRNKFAEPYLNRWTPENSSNEYPSFVNPTSQGTKSVNSYTVEDASYVKLKTIRLTYTLPEIFQTLRSAQIYITGENLVTITDYDGIDPAINPNGNANYRIDLNAYPTARTFILGLKIGL